MTAGQELLQLLLEVHPRLPRCCQHLRQDVAPVHREQVGAQDEVEVVKIAGLLPGEKRLDLPLVSMNVQE
ncbi:MAG: hypothetical protein CVU38_05535 [Chloroflexi bacterium HGW-Chloroflexi-1]|nr:MAG: hypothetical protein CVU38_05535 [Chloroflexi bacterium HGW-Chloroflexi-1]